MTRMTTTSHDRGNNESLCTGISQHSGVFVALSFADSKTFKTERGATRWLAKRGIAADGSRLAVPARSVVEG